MMAATQWILKLLSGSHQGAEMPLDARSYIMGRSEDCDIVLHDEMLSEQLFQLNVSDSGITLVKQGQCLPVYISGELDESETIVVTEFEIYTVGSLHFCFGIVGAVWPELILPVIGGSARVVEGKNKEPQGPRNGQVLLAGNAKVRVKVIANISVLLLFIVGGLMFGNGRLDAEEVLKKPTLDVIKMIQQELGFSQLSVERLDDNGNKQRWAIKGYVGTKGELALLKQRLQFDKVISTLDIRVMGDIKRSTETLLKQFQMQNLLVSYGNEGGELVVSGVHPNFSDWRRLKKLLIADIPGLRKVTDQVESQEGRVQRLREWILEEHLDDEVTVVIKNGRLSILSDIALEQSSAWQRIVDRFQVTYGSALDVSITLNGRPTIDIRSVSLGEIPYLILSNGRRYTAGSYVRDGFYVDKIDKNTVIFKRGVELIKYRVGMRAG